MNLTPATLPDEITTVNRFPQSSLIESIVFFNILIPPSRTMEIQSNVEDVSGPVLCSTPVCGEQKISGHKTETSNICVLSAVESFSLSQVDSLFFPHIHLTFGREKETIFTLTAFTTYSSTSLSPP